MQIKALKCTSGSSAQSEGGVVGSSRCKIRGPLSYKVKLTNGQIQNHIRKHHVDGGYSVASLNSPPIPVSKLLEEDVDLSC